MNAEYGVPLGMGFKRCSETRAHYAHEWYNPIRQNCPGGPDENTPSADACMWCGRQPAAGLASINNRRYCHGDDDPEPTCYQSAQWCLSDLSKRVISPGQTP